MCELLAQEYHAIYGIQTGSVRIFSAYGPGLRKQILWDIYQKALKSEKIALFGSGEETRDFIFVEDIARAIQLVLEKGVFNGNTYNLGSGTEVSIRELGELFLSSLGMKNAKLIFSGETKPGDPLRWCADIELIKGLGFAPGTQLEQGLLEYARWVKALKGN
jgi:nucleoside-diphosphate-sugar epimerase